MSRLSERGAAFAALVLVPGFCSAQELIVRGVPLVAPLAASVSGAAASATGLLAASALPALAPSALAAPSAPLIALPPSAVSATELPESAPAALPARPPAIAPARGAAAVFSAAAAALNGGKPGQDAGADRARLEAFWEGAGMPAQASEADAALDAVVTGGASADFTRRVRAHVARTVPAPVLRELAKGGYRIEINSKIRQGREDLHEDNDYTGGFHSYGPKGKFIIIAEFIKYKKTGEWQPNRVWENAIDHEIGHAVAYLLGERAGDAAEAAGQTEQAEWYRTKGISEAPAFRAAWMADYAAIPEELKKEKLPDGKINDFYYFLHPDENGWYQRARQETFAEGFDILLRGPASHFNYENFRRCFPRSAAVLRAIVEREYGPIFPAAEPPADAVPSRPAGAVPAHTPAKAL